MPGRKQPSFGPSSTGVFTSSHADHSSVLAEPPQQIHRSSRSIRRPLTQQASTRPIAHTQTAENHGLAADSNSLLHRPKTQGSTHRVPGLPLAQATAKAAKQLVTSAQQGPVGELANLVANYERDLASRGHPPGLIRTSTYDFPIYPATMACFLLLVFVYIVTLYLSLQTSLSLSRQISPVPDLAAPVFSEDVITSAFEPVFEDDTGSLHTPSVNTLTLSKLPISSRGTYGAVLLSSDHISRNMSGARRFVASRGSDHRVPLAETFLNSVPTSSCRTQSDPHALVASLRAAEAAHSVNERMGEWRSRHRKAVLGGQLVDTPGMLSVTIPTIFLTFLLK